MTRSLNWGGSRSVAGACACDSGRRTASRTDFNHKLCAATAFFHKLQHPLQVVVLQPVDDKAVGSQQAQDSPVIDRLKRPNPGVELLLGQLGLQDAKALVP